MSENKLKQMTVFFAIWLVVGLLLGMAFKEQTRIRTAELPSARLPDLARAYVQEKRSNAALEEEIRQLRQRINELESAFASGTKQAQVLSQSLQEAKMLAGLLEVEGPGIELTLQDSKKRPAGDSPELLPELYTIHDYDLLRVVNELRQAGAEAISINGQRIVASTAIRCTGPVVFINDVKMASPFVVLAIGDPKTLIGALEMPGGALSDLKSVDPKMVQIRRLDTVRIPAYSGSTQFRYARPVTMEGESKLMIAVGFIGLLLGVVIASLLLDIPLPEEWAAYLSLAALAGLDTAFGGWRAALEGRFHADVFVSGFIVNALLAALLAYLGDRIGVDLFLAAVVTLGGRMFLNLSLIRRYYLNQLALRRQRG